MPDPQYPHSTNTGGDGRPLPLWQQATTEVVAKVVDTEIEVLLAHPITAEQALTALAARQEIIDRFIRHRWLAMETARRAGATWQDIDRTLERPPGQSQREYQTVLARQQQFGLRPAEGHQPGVEPHLQL